MLMEGQRALVRPRVVSANERERENEREGGRESEYLCVCVCVCVRVGLLSYCSYCNVVLVSCMLTCTA